MYLYISRLRLKHIKGVYGMNKRIEEMVALGAAYALNCQPCMEVHKKAAIDAGVTVEEMQAVIRIAEGVKTGAGKRAQQVAEGLFGAVQGERCCPPGSACCQ